MYRLLQCMLPVTTGHTGLLRHLGYMMHLRCMMCLCRLILCSSPGMYSHCVSVLVMFGAQLLMASGLAAVSPLQIIPHLYYPAGIGVMVLLAIILQFPREK